MAITWNFGVDWDGNGFIAKYAQLTDAVNLFGTEAYDISTLYSEIVGTGGSTLSDDRKTNQGSILRWTTGTSTSYINIGKSGSNYNISAGAGTYTASIWVRNQTGSSANSVSIGFTLFNQNIALATTSATVPYVTDLNPNAVNTGWVRFDVTGTAPVGTTNLYIAVVRSSGSSSWNYAISGAMIVSGSTVPTGFNCGTVSLYENITPYVTDARWQLGFTRPFQNIADMGRLQLTLRNDSKLFSPENTSSTIYGQWRGKFVSVSGTPPNGTPVNLWSGWVDDIQPLPGLTSTRTAALVATDTRRFLEGVDGRISTQVNGKIEDLYNAILDLCTSSVETVDGYTPLADLSVTSSQVIPYAGDQWEEGVDALRALQDTAGAVHDKFLFNEYAYRTRFTVDQMYGSTGTAGTAADYNITRMRESRYTYGRDVINEVTVDFFPREAGTATDSVLWKVGEPFALDPKEIRTIRASYNDDTSDVTISGLNAYGTALSADSGITVTGTVFKSQSADITFTNSSQNAGTVSAYRVRGQKLKAKDKVTYVQSDDDSITDVGRIGAQYGYKLLWSAEGEYGAKAFAGEVLRQRSQPIGKFTEITLKPVNATEENTYIVSQFTGSAFKSVRVQDEQVVHDGFYWLIGVEYNWRTAGLDYEIKWFLEPQANAFRLADATFGVLGYGRL